MDNRQHSLRNIALKLNVSGTAEVLDEQRLYKGGYGFVRLLVYVPITQYTENPVCTAFCTTRDELGREKTSSNNYALWYDGVVERNGASYTLFERPLPKEFTETTGELKITFNYYDTEVARDEQGHIEYEQIGIPKRRAKNLLVSSRYTTTVREGGYNDDEAYLGIEANQAAQIVDNMVAIGQLRTEYDETVDYINETVGELANEKDRAEAAEADLSGRIDAANQAIESVRNLGDFAGTFDTKSALPTNKAEFSHNVSENDFVTVRADETHDNYTTRYVIRAIASDGTITWEYDITYTTDITGKMDKRPAATEDNLVSFDAQGNAKDSGYNGADIDRAQATADEAKAIALGRDNSKVFETTDEMWEWLSNPENTAGLVPGASLYVIDADAPDYWWTGSNAEEYHDKTDLSIFYNKDEIDEMLAATRSEIIETFQLEQTVKSTDNSAKNVVTLYKAEFDALPYKDPNTLYIVPDDTDPDEATLQDQVDDLRGRIARLEEIVGGLIE